MNDEKPSIEEKLARIYGKTVTIKYQDTEKAFDDPVVQNLILVEEEEKNEDKDENKNEKEFDGKNGDNVENKKNTCGDNEDNEFNLDNYVL